MPRSGIVRSYGNSIFSFLKPHIVSYSDYGNYINSHQKCRRAPFSLYHIYHLLFTDFSMMAILTGMGWDLLVVLICVYLMIIGAEHLFMCPWPTVHLL